MSYFKKDPQIVWSRVLCPVCNQPTGPDTACYKLAIDQPTKMVHPKVGLLPILTENCVFRQEKLWKADINYPFSELLFQRIDNEKINGLERIYPIKPYSFQISVGRLFDDDEIKRSINLIFNTFIKELQARENNAKIDKRLVGIKFPNKKTFIIDEEDYNDVTLLRQQQNYIQILLDEIPDVEGIFLENGEDENAE